MPINISTDAQGGYLKSPHYVEEIFPTIRRATKILDLFDVKPTKTDPVYVTVQSTTAKSSAEWLTEQEAKPVGSITFEQKNVSLKKVGLILEGTDQASLQSWLSLEGFMKSQLRLDIAEEIDEELLTGQAGSSGSGLVGIDYISDASSYTSLSPASTECLSEDLINAIASLAAVNVQPTAILMSYRHAACLASERDADGHILHPSATPVGGSFMGVPIVASNAVTSAENATDESYTASVYVCNWKLAFKIWMLTKLELSVNPYATASTDYWLTDSFGVRAVARLTDPMCIYPSAMCSWSGTYSMHRTWS